MTEATARPHETGLLSLLGHTRWMTLLAALLVTVRAPMGPPDRPSAWPVARAVWRRAARELRVCAALR